MTSIHWWFVQNSLTVAVLAALVALACCWLQRRPAVQHALWVVVLIKFLMPPLVAWPWPVPRLPDLASACMPSPTAPGESHALPEPLLAEGQAGLLAGMSGTGRAAEPAAPRSIWPDSPADSSARPRQSGRQGVWLVFASWLCGTAGIAVWQARGIGRLWRIADRARPAPPRLVAQVNRLARRLRVRPVPASIAHEIATPLVLCLVKVRLLWPACLSGEPSSYRGAIAHELAHIKRRDHWVRLLELVAGCIWWWNPLFWLVRRRLRESAELACDAVALGVMPHRRREYAELFLELSRSDGPRAAAAALGISTRDRRSVKRRLAMILSERVTARTTWSGAVAVLVLALLALPSWPLGQAGEEEPVRSLERSTALAADRDSDGDGLSDFQERHKYRTDPRQKDSDGDGVPDGQWDERREYTYTIRSIVRVMPPCGRGGLSDDYQDARILEETDEYVELEVVHYPLATCGEAISQNANWRQDYAGMTEYLKPRVNTNWDEPMRRELLAELNRAGIDVDQLTDKQVVEQVSDWFVGAYQYLPLFNALHVHYPQGRIAVIPGREANIHKDRDDWTLEQLFEHELLGRSMYTHKTRGSCTSSAMALTTVLRAIGIPTRMVLAIPIVDGSDADQVAKLRHRITHHEVRETVLDGVSGLGSAFASHTFNEVFVGGRWRRLNYNRLGQPTLDRRLFGLLTHVHTFNDLSEWGLQPTWGVWNATGRRTYVFAHSNPYATVAISDRFGAYANIPNPPAEELGLNQLTISKAYWFDSPDRPKSIPADAVKPDGSGHVLLHVDQEYDDRFAELYEALDKGFVFRAEGQPDVPARAERGYWGTEFYLRITPSNFAKMSPGVPYQLAASNAGRGPQWKIQPEVTIVKRQNAADEGASEGLTIGKAYWFHSPQRPEWIGADEVPRDASGHILVHVEEELSNAEYVKLYAALDKTFVLRAEGQPLVVVRAERGWWAREFYLRIPPLEFAKMREGVAYSLFPANSNPGPQWQIQRRLTIVKDATLRARPVP